MIKIEYPPPAFRIKNEKGKDLIFDTLRRKWLILTPEEWVRQNFVQYLVKVMQYPATLIAMEKEIRLGELSKRFDLMVYNSSHLPWMIVECKEMNVKLDEQVLMQVLRYNMSVPVNFIVITNGTETHAWEEKSGELVVLEELPQPG